MNILSAFGEAVEPEVVTPSPVPTTALARFSDVAGQALKADALAVLSIKVKPVETTEAAAKLADQRAQVKNLLKNIDARRKAIVEPLKKEASAVDAEVRTWSEPLRHWDRQAESMLLAYQRLQADQTRMAYAAQQKALQEAAERQAEAEAKGDTVGASEASLAIMRAETEAVPEPIRGFKTDAGTTYTKRTWKVEVIDPSLVPPNYLTPDLKKIQAAVDAGAREIEGCNIFEEESLPVRTR